MARVHALKALGVLVLVLGAFIPPADALQLISAQEAALPTGDIPELVLRGSPVRRPHVSVVSPASSTSLVSSPLRLKMNFQAFGGAKVDPESIVVIYKKTPAIDITQRIRAFIGEDGIDVPDAEVPPGLHNFRIQLKDKNGRVGAADFGFQVGR